MSSRKELIKELTKVFNHWIKVKDANSNNLVRCFTCPRSYHIQSMDAGHFQVSKKSATRWDEMNVKPQCRECNSKENGMREVFAERLDEVYGLGTADKIIRKSNMIKKYTNSELKHLINYYQDLILSS